MRASACARGRMRACARAVKRSHDDFEISWPEVDAEVGQQLLEGGGADVAEILLVGLLQHRRHAVHVVSELLLDL